MVTFFRNKNAKSSVLTDMATKQLRYDSLVRAYHVEIFRYGYWLVKDKQVAEDLVQETFLRAWKSLDSLKDEKAAKSWLITILRRENARRFERKQFQYSDVEQETIEDNVTLGLEAQIERTEIRSQIAKLPEEYREPLLLQVVGGYSGDEIAELLGLNRNTVMTRLFRARSQLKEALETSSNIRGSRNG
ncbi:sigma-70 family RNA polymerase sigma factor [Paraferrimonas haliotis]|uniref:RNA polymerase sigma factor n=1 Tax=Paraferrimonas haliotis TaxID=2013866 RepID=A0AA37TJD4_9GAMM|nr:sigma-70 family RNA polymerase sigma factor [Paraferrimonas haliotis]GLS82627.1 RNA polymerase sigma factor [Paraferrimonas haliotis]